MSDSKAVPQALKDMELGVGDPLRKAMRACNVWYGGFVLIPTAVGRGGIESNFRTYMRIKLTDCKAVAF